MTRFDTSPGIVATFASLQLAVYGLAQIPLGVALDRVGPRRLLVAGALAIGLAQLLMAIATDVPTALIARILLGVGDATAFISVLRLLPSWFSPFRIPLLTQLTSILGLLGQVISAVPFMGVLHRFGWPVAFSSLASFSFVAALLVLAFVRDTPINEADSATRFGQGPRAEVAPEDGGQPRHGEMAKLKAVLTSPWTWLGFFSHWSGAGPAMTFTILWGVPFMTLGMGMASPSAAAILVLFTGMNIVLGPIVGYQTARRPRGRLIGVVGAALVTAVVWTLVLVPSEPLGSWAAVILAAALAVSGVSSSIGFDFVRQGTPAARLGTAIGTANMGGFTAAFLAVQGIGVALDRLAGGGTLGWADFRVAMALQGVMWLVGLIGLVVSAHLVRKGGGEAV